MSGMQIKKSRLPYGIHHLSTRLREGKMPSGDDPTASYSSFQQFLQSGRCSNKHEAEAIWAYWRDKRTARERPKLQPSSEEAIVPSPSREVAGRRVKWIFLAAVVIAPILWSQWYYSNAQVFRRFSDDLGRYINRETNSLYLHYFNSLGARSGDSYHHGTCGESRCDFRYTHSFSIPAQGIGDRSYLGVSVDVSLWPSPSGIDRQLVFLSSTRWWPRGTDIYWKIESARWSDEQPGLTNWQTLYSGTQSEVYRAPGTIRPLLANTISAIEQGLRKRQSR